MTPHEIDGLIKAVLREIHDYEEGHPHTWAEERELEMVRNLLKQFTIENHVLKQRILFLENMLGIKP